MQRKIGTLSLLLVGLTLLSAAAPNEARVTQVVKEVKLSQPSAPVRPAVLNDEVRNRTAVSTGSDSRAELTFTDQTLARLGANTIFTFNDGHQRVDLGSGAMLLYVPKSKGGATVNTAAITAAITGTTCLFETHRKKFTKIIFLEGSGRAFLKRDPTQSVVLHPGDMLVVRADAVTLPRPQQVNLRLLRKTCRLLYPSLPSAGLMLAEEQNQIEQLGEQTLVDPASQDVLDQRANIRPGKGPGAP